MSNAVVLHGSDEYVAGLLKDAEECRRQKLEFEDVVRTALSDVLGATQARALEYYVGPEGMRSPRVLVERLVAVFRDGSPYLLRELVFRIWVCTSSGRHHRQRVFDSVPRHAHLG